MKILELRFKNLNSLYGEWLIDFNAPEFTGNGIFALTGPTGAGKSTILDAICLALYGATPRLGRITKSGNEIMSRQTGECYAEVLFESQAGCYRCHWEQHRARRRPEGDLQAPSHEIAQGDGAGQVIENKIRSVAAVIEDKTGMDYDRFTRSILLAQGGFDTFLKADAEQKSIILEQITGTRIYSEISRRVHNRRRDEQTKLDLLMSESNAIQMLDSTAETALADELKTKQSEAASTAAAVDKAAAALVWLKTIQSLEQELSDLIEGSQNLKADIDAFQPSRQRLEIADRAAELDGQYATIKASRKLQQEEQAALTRNIEQLPGLKTALDQLAKSLSDADQSVLDARQAQTAAGPLINQARAMDQKMDTIHDSLTSRRNDLRDFDGKLHRIRTERQTIQEQIESQRKHLAAALAYLREHEADAWLVSGLAGVEEQIKTLVNADQELKTARTGLVSDQKKIVVAEKRLALLVDNQKIKADSLKQMTGKIKVEKDRLQTLLDGRLLREWRAQQASLMLEISLIQRIASLEEQRSALKDGVPCPLCGSKDHPYAMGNVPAVSGQQKQLKEIDNKIIQAEQQEDKIRKLIESEQEIVYNLKDIDKKVSVMETECQAISVRLTDQEQAVTRRLAHQQTTQQAVLEPLKPLGIESLSDEDDKVLIASLKKRLALWHEQSAVKDRCDRQLIELESNARQLDALIETHELTSGEWQQALAKDQKSMDELVLSRNTLFGGDKADEAEAKFNKACTDAEAAAQKIREHHDLAKHQYLSLKSQSDAIADRIEQRKDELVQLLSAFMQQLRTKGFESEYDFELARLPLQERKQLQGLAKTLDDREANIQTRMKDRQERLQVERKKEKTDQNLADLEIEHEGFTQALDRLRERVITIQTRLADNQASLERMKHQKVMIDQQTKTCLHWEKLHILIGSADGKKFRNFAQGLTFELLVSHANRQLVKMTDRYLLLRDQEDPLDLNVVDNYQAGEIRSTQNLSGGESFIVSLALALGLSRMASQKVRVDSLFLDEGFGTLDEDALESALETLSGLQQDGKLIGVISHVPALKERIRTQISISPVSGGKSRIDGPGCSKVKKVT